MASEPGRVRGDVLGVPIDAVDWGTALDRIKVWARSRESRYVCICNAHSVITAHSSPDFRRVVDEADMATPDGAPVAWTLRRKGFAQQQRIAGPDLMWQYCQLASQDGVSVFLYGGSQRTLDRLRVNLAGAFPSLRIAGAISPPFHSLDAAEDAADVRSINASDAGVVFVGLGCPKQEMWMSQHRGRIRAVMIGVGAAFDFHAGTTKRAPRWMQNAGLEWLHRLAREPRRLWRRYLVTNSLFVAKTLQEMLGQRHTARKDAR
ncbi:MAG: WecB/TagA/CpsF family glycosyltransferase [Burkholderiales bacterium]|nr:WecB/TagA/CpsF family glycosyltransferase [Burkholderiales bacterium]